LAKLKPKDILHIQSIIGSGIFYTRVIDSTIIVAINELLNQQSNATEKTMERINTLLDYLATYPDAKIVFRASDMILKVESNK